jgi:hypothetical protein
MKCKITGLFTTILIIIFAGECAYAQSTTITPKKEVEALGRIALSVGISTMRFLGNNPAVSPIIQRDESKPLVNGASLFGTHPGGSIFLTMYLDKNEKFRIPIGFDYFFLDGGEKMPVSKIVVQTFTNKQKIGIISAGFDYSFYQTRLAMAKAYAGLMTKSVFIGESKFMINTEYSDQNLNFEKQYSSKNSTFRFGGMIRLGIEGELTSPWFVNTYVGVGAMNLFGRDDARGELLTLSNNNETKETILYYWQFSINLQYRF